MSDTYAVTLTDRERGLILLALDRLAKNGEGFADVEGSSIDVLRACISGTDVYRVRVAIDGGVMVKVNEEMWTAPIGWASTANPEVDALRASLTAAEPVSAALAAMLGKAGR